MEDWMDDSPPAELDESRPMVGSLTLRFI
jgi:hypothetical protein